MFCPSCRTEYRAGFTKCADCGVDLVATLPAEGPAEDADILRNAEGLELLWSGVSDALCARIDTALGDAHIFHKNTVKALRLSLGPGKGVNFIWIDTRDRASSRAILEKIVAGSGAMEAEAQTNASRGRFHFFGGPAPNDLLPRDESGARADNAPTESAELPESDETDEPLPDDVVEDFDPDDATTEVWAGGDKQTADYLKLSLSGVGVGCVLKEDRGKMRVLVLPEQEKRAREIVREVVEGTPPG